MNVRPKERQVEFQKFCIEKGYTAQKVAELLGISKSTVYSYYYGQRVPSRQTAKKMKEALGIEDVEKMFDM